MYGVIWISLFFAMMGGYWYATQPVGPDAARPDLLAANMLVYQQAAVTYEAAHATFTGTIPASSLVFPSWYREIGPWIAEAPTAGTVATYNGAALDVPIEAMSEALHKLSGDNIAAGIAGSSGLIVPSNMVPSVVTPADVPIGAAVIVTEVQ